MNLNESIVEVSEGNIRIIKYNKPAKKNAIDNRMYLRVTNILKKAATDDTVSVTVLTGVGDYYSSGNDFTTALEEPSVNSLDILKEYIDAFIKFPKLLVAIVNGPAIGIAATTLALCDIVYASENSYFYTPFTKLGIVAEGCSTATFPRLIGDRKAAEMLFLNHKMSAVEALNCGFINDVYKPEELQSKVWTKIVEMSRLPKYSLSATKKLIRGVMEADLLKANDTEIKELAKIWESGMHLENIANSLSQRTPKSML